MKEVVDGFMVDVFVLLMWDGKDVCVVDYDVVVVGLNEEIDC